MNFRGNRIAVLALGIAHLLIGGSCATNSSARNLTPVF
jgi:hypothetical protein